MYTSAYVSIRQHMSAYVAIGPCIMNIYADMYVYLYIYISISIYYIYIHEQKVGAEARRMLTYADVCRRMLTYADVCRRMLTYADVC
jgi:hypothetical protein